MTVSGDSVTEANISNLLSSTTYSIQVAAVNSAGTGPYSDTYTIDTVGKEVFAKLSCFLHYTYSYYFVFFLFVASALSVSVTTTSTTSLALSWTLDNNVTATDYTISYSNTNTDCFTDSDDITGIATSEAMYNLTDLQEGTEYSITITALLSDGETAEDSLTATTMAAG